MTYEDLKVYVDNQYANAIQNDMLSSEVIIEKSDYLNLLEICRDWDIRCYPLPFGLNSFLLDFTKDNDKPDLHLTLIEGFEKTSGNLLKVILEWDEIPNDEEITFIWYDDDDDKNSENDDNDEEESE